MSAPRRSNRILALKAAKEAENAVKAANVTDAVEAAKVATAAKVAFIQKEWAVRKEYLERTDPVWIAAKARREAWQTIRDGWRAGKRTTPEHEFMEKVYSLMIGIRSIAQAASTAYAYTTVKKLCWDLESEMKTASWWGDSYYWVWEVGQDAEDMARLLRGQRTSKDKEFLTKENLLRQIDHMIDANF